MFEATQEKKKKVKPKTKKACDQDGDILLWLEAT